MIYIIKKIINIFSYLFPVQKNKILFQSGRSKIDCSPYAVYKYIKDNCPQNFKCVWLVEKGVDVSMLNKGDYCYYKTIKGIIHQATSKYWIRSQSLGGFVCKKKNQIYIQMWHGAGALKKSGYDCLKKKDRPTEEVHHVKEWDYLIATDKENKKAMISSTNYKGKTIVLGNADSDFLVNYTKKDKNVILKKLKLTSNEKGIILYAPTFRDNELNDISNVTLPIDILKNIDNYIILLRLHPLMNEKIKNLKLPNNFINVGNYPNINDLYIIADILITDYSSIIFPYAILNKKLIFYPYDIKEYVKIRGNFYLKYETLPGPICYNEKELFNTIKNIDNLWPKYVKKLNEFNERYNKLNDGKVCERFVDKLKNGKFIK